MILVIDNYDSFTWNLVQYLGELGADPLVRRNDEITVAEARDLGASAIVISPGPGVPADAGVTIDIVRELGQSTPVLGVCLGHQAIAEAFGGRVIRAERLMHGKTSMIEHDGTALFERIDSPVEVMRYHSLTVEKETLPPELEVRAWAKDDPGEIHGLAHKTLPVWGVQFHPESVMTRCGRQILENFLRLAQ
jgi:anthranilate synthase/aminodeoxychorismate synthase-like glutamine amidotransferase